MNLKVVAYRAHIGLVDEKGFSLVNIIDQGSLKATLTLAHDIVDAMREYKNPREVQEVQVSRICHCGDLLGKEDRYCSIPCAMGAFEKELDNSGLRA